MKRLDNISKIKDSSFIYTPEGMYFSEQRGYNPKKHVIWFDKSKKQYEKDAENLQNSKISKQIKGYELKIGNDTYKIKYDTRKNEFVDYAVDRSDGDEFGNVTISYYGLHPTWGSLEYLDKIDKDSKKGEIRELSIGEALRELDK